MYLAMAAGKAIITQEAYGTPGTPAIPALVVPPTADALKAAILDLASNRDERASLEQAAVTYYREYLDRKSVVSGKSVSVRVDLGGRRIITKKKKEQKSA